MSVKYILSDLLNDTRINCIIHQANCQKVMGGGIALSIRNKYPEAYEADCLLPNTPDKLGKFSFADTYDGKTVFNLYGQLGFGHVYRQTDYEAVTVGLEKIRTHILKNKPNAVVGMPFMMGCALGGGDWRVVEAIIMSVFGELRLPVYICILPERETSYHDYVHKTQKLYFPQLELDASQRNNEVC